MIFGRTEQRIDVYKRQLHDCAKQIDRETQLAMCDKLGVPLDDLKRENTALLHAELGARLAETEFRCV